MQKERIAVIGLGYVGLPLGIALARKFDTVGFDTNAVRIGELRAGNDNTREVTATELQASALALTADAAAISDRTIYIVTVPTPINEANRPDFTHVLNACELIGPRLSAGAIVVFESTVFPGATEDICGPALQRASGLECGVDFKLGYSPERINPGDKAHPLEKIVKVVAGQDGETLERLSAIYAAVVDAGVHRAPSIKVAEAAKVIENAQRDINIALMNELSKICHLVGIRTADVLAAAGTKWNFLNFHPGLVGGHCIGVDPYYLTAKAEELGYQPEVILAGRRINDSMGAYVGQNVIKLLSRLDRPLRKARVGILGLTFKENVPDIRNSKVIDIYRELQSYGVEPMAHDPLADWSALRTRHGIAVADLSEFQDLDALILAVPHTVYELDAAALGKMVAPNGYLIDLRSRLGSEGLRADIGYWSL